VICSDGLGRLDGGRMRDGWKGLDGNGWKRWVVRMDSMDRDADGRLVGWKGGLDRYHWGTGTGQHALQKKVSHFPVLSRVVTDQTLPGRE